MATDSVSRKINCSVHVYQDKETLGFLLHLEHEEVIIMQSGSSSLLEHTQLGVVVQVEMGRDVCNNAHLNPFLQPIREP